MADARFKAAAKRLKDTLGKKYEIAETTPTAGAVGTGKLYIGGQIYDGAIDGVTTVKNTGRLAAAQYAPTTGGSTITRGSGGTSTGGVTGVYLPLDGSVAMTGSLDMGGHNITNVVTVDGRNLETDGITLDAIKAAPLLTLGGDGTLTNERSLLFGSSFDTVDGGANASFTVSLKTPGTLDVSTTNDAANNHTHAITASSAPGAVSSLLKTAPDGSLILSTLTATTKLRTTLIDTVTSVNLTLQPGANLVLSPAAGAVTVTTGVSVGSSNYASQTTGWRVTYAGEGDFRYLYTDEMHAKAFIADLEQALAGGQIIAKSVTLLYSPFTAPAAGATAPLTVKDLPSATGMAVFQNGDIVRLRQFSRSAGSLSITDCWGSVALDTSYGVGGFDTTTKSQRYTFTRSVAPNAGAMSVGAVIEADAIILDYGTSGNGYYEVNAIDGLYAANSPYAQVVTWTGHPATGKALKMRLGNLSGVTDTDLNPFGYGVYSDNVFLKGSVSAANNQVLINQDGIRVRAYNDPTADVPDVNAYRFETTAGEVVGGLYSRGAIGTGNIQSLVTYPQAAAGYAFTEIKSYGKAANGGWGLVSIAAISDETAPSEKSAIIRVEADNSAGFIRMIADDYIRFEAVTQSSADHNPFLDLGANLGSASKRWGVLYANQIIAGTISGATMAGATWQYTGSMVIDANSGADTVVSVVNNGAGAVTFNVAGVITQSGTAVSLSGHTHSTYLLKAGDTITGNMAVSAGVTIDGVDISVHAADANAHHARGHAITSSTDHTVAGAALDVVGLTAANALGILTPSANPGAASALLKTDTAGVLTLVQATATTRVRTPLIDTAAGNLSIAPVGGTTAVTGALTATTTISAVTNVSTPAIVTASGNLSLAPTGGVTAVTGALSLTGTLSSTAWNVTNAGTATLVTVSASTSVTTPTITNTGALTLSPTGNLTLTPGGNMTLVNTANLGSDNYASQVTGWRITGAGGADFRYLYTDEMRAKAFIADLEQALAGSQIIAKSVTTLAADFRIPYFGGKQEITVDDLPSAPGMQVFQAGDYIALRSFSRLAGELLIGYAWGQVHNPVDNGNGTQTWTFTRSGTSTYNTITQRGSATSAAIAAGTSVSPSRPTGVVSGDALVAIVTHDGSPDTITANGWTPLGSAAGTDINGAIYYKVAGGAEPTSYAFSTANSHALAASVVAYFNVDTTYTPIDDYSIGANVAGANLNAATIWGSSTAGRLVFLGGISNNTAATPPSGSPTFTELIDAGATGIRVYVAHAANTVSGETGTKTATIGSSSYASIGAMIMLRPTVSVFVDAQGGSIYPGIIVKADAIVLDFGMSGNGYHEINAADGVNAENSPYSQVVTWTTHPGPAGNRVVRTRTGNLYGLFGVSNEYGFYAGNGTSTTSAYVRLSSVTSEFANVPISMYSTGTKYVGLDTSKGLDLKIGATQVDELPAITWRTTVGVGNPLTRIIPWDSGTEISMRVGVDAPNTSRSAFVSLEAYSADSPIGFAGLYFRAPATGQNTIGQLYAKTFTMNGEDLILSGSSPRLGIGPAVLQTSWTAQFWTTSNWHKTIVLPAIDNLVYWAKPAIGAARGIINDGNYWRFVRSAADDTSAAAITDLLIDSNGNINAYSTFAVAPAVGSSGIYIATPNGQTFSGVTLAAADMGSSYGPHITIQRNNNASTPSAGFLYMVARTGTPVAVWVDNTGNLRLNTGALPTSANDTSGVVVGTQTSWVGLKKNIEPWTDTQGALDAVLTTPLYSYRLKADDSTQYHGLVITEKDRTNNTWYGENLASNQIPSLNERNLFGYLIASIQAQQAQIQTLQAELANLRRN